MLDMQEHVQACLCVFSLACLTTNDLVMFSNNFFHRYHCEQTAHFCHKRSTSQFKEVSKRELAVDFLKNDNKILVSSTKHLVKARDLGFIDSKTSGNNITHRAEGTGQFNQCMSMLNQPPTNRASIYFI
jgi:hypothetical protein